jgi:hypothetical protein
MKKWREAADVEEPKDVPDLILDLVLDLEDNLVLTDDPGATIKFFLK